MLNRISKLILLILLFLYSTVLTAEFMQIHLIGTGSPRPDIKRAGPAVLVEAGGEYLLFDVGRSVIQRLTQLDIPIAEIENIFLTHLHSDHISALDDVWLTGWIYQRHQPLQVHGPKGTKSFLLGLQQAYSYDARLRNEYSGLSENSSKLIAYENTPGVIYENNGVKVTAFLVNHKPVEPAYGYRIDFGDRSVVISGDTTFSENLIDHSQNIDLLIHEIFASQDKYLEKNPRLQKIEQYHTNPQQLLNILSKTKPKMTVLTHIILIGIDENDLINQFKDNYPGNVVLGEDLMKIEISSEIRVVRYNYNR